MQKNTLTIVIALALSACLTTGVATAASFDGNEVSNQQTVAVKTQTDGAINVSTMAAGADVLFSHLATLPANSTIMVDNATQYNQILGIAERNGTDISLAKTFTVICLSKKVADAGYESIDQFAKLVDIAVPQSQDERIGYITETNAKFDELQASGTLPVTSNQEQA